MTEQYSRRHIGRFLATGLLLAPVAACVPVMPAPPREFAVPADVLFSIGSASLRPEAQAALSDIVGQIRAVYANPTVRVIGHTDNIGSDAANDALSLRRAESVRSWLIVNGGLAPGVLSAEGRGKSEPIASNDTAAGRAQNRRVQLIATPT